MQFLTSEAARCDPPPIVKPTQGHRVRNAYQVTCFSPATASVSNAQNGGRSVMDPRGPRGQNAWIVNGLYGMGVCSNSATYNNHDPLRGCVEFNPDISDSLEVRAAQTLAIIQAV